MQNLILSNRIKTLCKQKNISVKSLLEDCNMNRNTIYDLEKKGAFPSADKIHTLAVNLDTTTDYLLGKVNTPYYVLINNHQNKTFTVDVGQLFQQDDTVRRYASRLFEAYNDIYNANTLLQDLLNDNNKKPENCNHVAIVLKYIIIVLGESLSLLKTTNQTKEYKTAVEILTKKEDTKKFYEELLSSFDDTTTEKRQKKPHPMFIIELRHLIAHYDHEKNEKYSNIVNSIHICQLKEEQRHFLYQQDFLATEIFTKLYREEYQTDETDEIIITKIVAICAEVLNLVCNCLSAMLSDFFETYNLTEYISAYDKNNTDKTTSSVNIASKNVYHTMKNSNNSIFGDNNIIGDGYTINREAKKLSKQENALIDLYGKLDVIKQAQLLAYAAELEKEV